MIETLIPDILRAVVTDIMLFLLIFTMSTPKCKKSIYAFTAIFIIVINITVNIFFYLTKNYTAVAKTDFLMLIIIAIALKPLFKETVMQWLFSYVTLLNIYTAIVFLSYYLSHLLPYPYYGNTIFRALFFGIIVIVFWKVAGPIYRKVEEYWHIYSLITVSLLINFLYYLFSGDVLQTMEEKYLSILLLIFLTMFIYLGIFLSLKIIIQKYELKEKNVMIENERNQMKQRLALMDDAVKQMRVSQHDRRHFNATIKELIEEGETVKALSLIDKYSVSLPQCPRFYCENVEVNAAVSYYAAMANEKGIFCDIKLNIPKEIPVDSLELAMVCSNFLENAVEGVMSVTDIIKRRISFTATYTGQLILEIENYYVGKVKTDKNGFPISEKEGHGLGSQSVASFAKKWNAELEYIISDEIFKVQMMI